MAGLDLTFDQRSASEIADTLGWHCGVDASDLCGALINALHRIDYLEREVKRLSALNPTPNDKRRRDLARDAKLSKDRGDPPMPKSPLDPRD